MLDYLALRKFVSPEYYDMFMDAYVHGRQAEKTSHPFYTQWMSHKMIHSFEVLDVGLLILRKDPALRHLPQDIKQDFADALLMHDLSRAFEIDPDTGKDILPNHGADAAKQLYKNGVRSINILLPVLMHDRLEDDLLHLPTDALDPVLSGNDPETLQVAKEILHQYHALPKEQRETAYKGMWLVKDADRLANIMTIDRLVPFFMNGLKNHEAAVSQPMAAAFLSTDGIVTRNAISTMPDHIPHLFSWMRSMYFPYSFKLALQEELPKRVFNTIVKEAEKLPIKPHFKQQVQQLKKFLSLTEERLKQRAGGFVFSIPFYSPLRMSTLAAA